MKSSEKAHGAVMYARKKGILPDPKTLICADCNAPASHYDHRDYDKPLDVEAVCVPCNIRRGSGLNKYERVEYSKHDVKNHTLPAVKVDAAIFNKTVKQATEHKVSIGEVIRTALREHLKRTGK